MLKYIRAMHLTPPSPEEKRQRTARTPKPVGSTVSSRERASVLECVQSSAALDFAPRRPGGVKCIALKYTSFALSLFAYAVHSLGAATVSVDTTRTYQTIEGLGGATAFYAGWIRDHPYKQEIYT